jgi:ABC-type Fe3+/spermidine/putrescine transport system ATPase subunit
MNHLEVGGRSVSVRPEQVTLTTPEADGVLHGRILEVTFAGAFTRFDILLDDDTQLHSVQPSNATAPFAPGDAVGVRLP